MIRRTFLLLALLAFVGCEDDGTGFEADISGRYELRTVNGSNLPANVTVQGIPASVQSGFLQVNADNTFTLEFVARVTISGQTQTTTQRAAGTWGRRDNAVTFTLVDGSTGSGTIAGNQITSTFQGNTMVFVK